MPPTLAPERISVETETVDEARSTAARADLTTSALALVHPDGTQAPLPAELQSVLLTAISSLAQNGSVTIARMPEELTSTVAADILGVSRPTLMKWVEDGTITSHKVGTHSRFDRKDVLALRDRRRASQRKALDELRALDEELDG